MFDGAGFRRFLETGETVSQDARLWHFRDSLAEHDKRYHGGMFEGGRCLFRQKGDEADNLGVKNQVMWSRPAGKTETPQDEYDSVVARYKGTPAWMKAPNGKPTNLTERQWVQVRTPSFKRWFGDWESAAEIKSFSERIARWMTQENIEKAKGKTREQIFTEFGNALEPIAYIPECYLSCLDSGIKDNRVYSGMGYMIDHAVNHHPEVELAEYLGIQSVIDSADDVKLDNRNKGRNKSILFIKNIGKTGVVIVSFDEGEDGKIVLHKSFFNKMKAGRFDKLPSIKLSSEVGNPSISHASEKAPAVRLSALEDDDIKPNIIRIVNGVSKVVDENGEPMVVYHGTKDRFDVFTGGDENNSSWFAEKIGYAREYAGNQANGDGDAWVKHCFLNIRKPFDMRDGENVVDGYAEISRTRHDGGEASDAEIAKIAKLLGTTADDIRSRFDNRQIWEITQSREFAEHLRSLGYDGIKFIECGDPTWATFDSTQVKSATDNSGAFSPDAVSTLVSEGSTEKAVERYLRMVEDEALAEHDRRFHGGCFEPSKKCCSRRDKQSRVDGVDEVECTEAKVAEIRQAIDFLMNTPPVCRLTGEEFKPDGRKLTDKVPEFFEREYDGVANSPEFGKVLLDSDGVKSDVGHKVGRMKAVAFAAVHDIIEKGISYNKSFNWKGRGWKTAVVAAPIEIAGVPFVGEVILKDVPGRKGLYLHEVEVQEKAKCGFLGCRKNAEAKQSRLVLSHLADCCLNKGTPSY